MPVRRFDGVDDRVTTAIGSCNWPWGTLAVLARRLSDGTWDILMGNHTSGGTREPCLAISSSNKLLLTGSWSADHPSSTDVLTEHGWVILAITKANGTQTPRLHIYRFDTEEWVHENAPGTETNPGSQAGGTIWFGGRNGGEYANIDLAACRQWPEVVLTDEQVEELATVSALKTGWVEIGGNEVGGAWAFDQASVEEAVEDLIGEADQTAITGSEVMAGNPPIPYETVAPLPATRPPLSLDVEIKTAEGAYVRLPANSEKASDRPSISGFGTARGDGFTSAGFTLPRDIFRDYPDLNLLDEVRFIGHDGEIAYEGRLHSQPRTNSPFPRISVSCVGWSSYLRSKKVSPLVIDRRLSGWAGPSTQREANLLAAENLLNGSLATGWQDSGEAGPAVIERFSRLTATASLDNTVDAWLYAGGEKIGALRFTISSAGGVSSVPSNWNIRGRLSDDDVKTTVDESAALTGEELEVEVVATGDRYYAEFLFVRTAESTSDGDWVVYFHFPRIIGTHGLESHGTEPEEGFYISDIIEYVIQTYYPKLDVSEIEQNSTTAQHCSYHDAPAYGAEIVQQLNDLALWDFNIWEDRKVYYAPADLTTHNWQVRRDDPGVSIDLQGDSIEDFYNGVTVHYSDFFGHSYTLYPDDNEELRGESEDNPANRHGEDLWMEITVPQQCLEAEALSIGRAYLREANRPKRPGTITVKGHIRDRAGNWQQGWKVRASETIIIADNPEESQPRLINSTSWDQESLTLTITLDNPSSLIDAVQARHARALEARGK